MSEKTPIEDFKGLIVKEDAVICQCLIELDWTPPNKWENRFKPGDHAWVDDIPYSPYPHYQAVCLSDAGDEYLCDHHHYSVRTALKCANKMSNSRKVGGSVH